MKAKTGNTLRDNMLLTKGKRLYPFPSAETLFTQRTIEDLKAKWEQTKNPLHVMEAFRLFVKYLNTPRPSDNAIKTWYKLFWKDMVAVVKRLELPKKVRKRIWQQVRTSFEEDLKAKDEIPLSSILWAFEHIANGFELYMELDDASLDEAFGLVRETGKRSWKKGENIQKANRLYIDAVCQLKALGVTELDVFECVAAKIEHLHTRPKPEPDPFPWPDLTMAKVKTADGIKTLFTRYRLANKEDYEMRLRKWKELFTISPDSALLCLSSYPDLLSLINPKTKSKIKTFIRTAIKTMRQGKSTPS